MNFNQRRRCRCWLHLQTGRNHDLVSVSCNLQPWKRQSATSIISSCIFISSYKLKDSGFAEGGSRSVVTPICCYRFCAIHAINGSNHFLPWFSCAALVRQFVSKYVRLQWRQCHILDFVFVLFVRLDTYTWVKFHVLLFVNKKANDV